MQANQIKMVEVFPMNATLQIPVYQRNYDWRQEQCEKLFADIETIARDGGTHFMGAIVYKDKKIPGMFNELIIVDGQQRITSLILLARALYDSTDDENTRQAIHATFFKHAVSNPKYKFKLQPTKYDVDIFKKLLSGEELDPREKSSRLYENYKIFKECIAASKFGVQEIHSALYSLQFVRMILDDEKPQQIFESMNSTGKSLTETELIRNFLLMDLDDATQEQLYKDYWLPMERLLQNSETLEKFMLHYLIYKRRSNKDMRNGKNIRSSTNALYETFKKYFQKNYDGDKAQQVEEFFKDMLHYAKFYQRLIFTAADKFEQLSALDRKFYELIYLLKAATSPIILMYLNERYEHGDFDAATFLAIVDVLISNKCRSKVCKNTGFDDEQTNANLAFRLDKLEKISVDSFWEAITDSKGNNGFPRGEDFQQALMSPELNLSLKSDFCKYLLYSFERHLNHSYNFAGYDDLSVELVIPKKLTAAWKNYLSDRNDLTPELWVNALGNLVLVTDANKNSATFSDKRGTYAASKFSYTKDLSRFADWTSRNVRRRTEFFAKLAPQIWILPEKYQPAISANENTYNLDSNFNELTGTEPKSISISKKIIPLTYWIDLLRTVAKELYSLDRDNFRQAVQESGNSKYFSTSPKNIPNPFQLDENYYLDSRFSTRAILNIARDIVENFDRLGGTNFKDEIEFTRKT